MYRVFNKKERKWVDNVYLSPYPCNKLYTLKKNIFGKEKLILESSDNYVIHQCTGIVDKNDKLIFEGDYIEAEISEDKVTCGIVIFSNELSRYVILSLDEDYYYTLGNHRKENIEVIGNILSDYERKRPYSE